MSDLMRKLKVQREEAIQKAETIVATAEKEKRALTDEEQANLDVHISASKALTPRIKELESVSTLRASFARGPQPRGIQNSPYQMPAGFSEYIRRGDMSALANLSPSSDGGVLIPTELYQSVLRLHIGFRPVESVARVIVTDNGDPMQFPRIDDTVTGEYLAASASTGSSTPPTSLDSVTLGAFKASSKPISVSRELLTDSQYDVGSEIVAVQVNRCGRLLNNSFTSGLGSTEPTGFLHGCTVLGASGSTLKLDDLLEMTYAVPQQFRKPTNVFQMSSATQKYLRSLKTGITSDQTPLWQESPRAGEPPTLYGARVIINEDLNDVGAGGSVVDNCVAYGDFSQFLIRKAGPSYILRFPLPTTDETGFIVLERADSKLLTSEAIVALGLSGS